jgi:hypothetical protein
MWLNFFILSLACLCVGFILGWIVARPRRWGVFAAGAPVTGDDQSGVDPLARRA